jgi:hypothetical protein
MVDILGIFEAAEVCLGMKVQESLSARGPIIPWRHDRNLLCAHVPASSVDIHHHGPGGKFLVAAVARTASMC